MRIRPETAIPLTVGAMILGSGLLWVLWPDSDDAVPPPPAAFVTGCTAEKTEAECNSLWNAYVEERRNPAPAPMPVTLPYNAAPTAQAPVQQAQPAPSQGLSGLEAAGIGIAAGMAGAAVMGYLTQGGGNASSLPPIERRPMVQTERAGRVPDVRPRQPYPATTYNPPAPATPYSRPQTPTPNPPVLQSRQVTPTPATPAPAIRQATPNPPTIRPVTPASPPRVSAPTPSRPSMPSSSSRSR